MKIEQVSANIDFIPVGISEDMQGYLDFLYDCQINITFALMIPVERIKFNGFIVEDESGNTTRKEQ